MFCALFGLSKQAYYKQIGQRQKKAEVQQIARTSVLRLRWDMPRLGTRKLHYLLKQKDIQIGRDQLFDLLRNEELLISKRKKYTVTTNSKHWLRKYPNLTKGLTPVRPEQLWVADRILIEADQIAKDKPVIIMCRTGRRSAAAIMQLEQQFGFSNLANLQGGIMAWSQEIDPEVQVY